MITWYYYGQNGIKYCLGKRSVNAYKWAYISCAFLGAIASLGIVLAFSDIMLGILVVPNAIALIMLSPKVAELSKEYFSLLKSGKFEEEVSTVQSSDIKIKKDDIRVIELEKNKSS